MVSDEILSKTIAHLKTTDALYDFIFEIDRVHEFLYKQTGLSPTQVIDQNMSSDHAQFLKFWLQNLSLEQVTLFLKELTDKLKQVPKFELALAFKYDNSFANTVFDWLKQNMGGRYLLEFSYDPEIIGGGVIVYDGLYKDNSLRKELKKFFESKDGLQKFI